MIAAQPSQQSAIHNKSGHSLFWKELYENRFLIVWVAAIMAAILVADITLVSPDDIEFGFRRGGGAGLLALVWFFSAALCSSSIVSPEIGDASLQFLSSLPLPRRRVWWTKASSGLITHILSMTAAIIVFGIFGGIAQICGVTDKPPFHGLEANLVSTGYVLFLTLAVFSVGAFVTMLSDRTLNSVFITLIVSIAFTASFLGLSSVLDRNHTWVIWTLIAVLTATLLAVSYQLFVHGETLKTTKRYSILLNIGLADIVPIIAAFVLAYIWITH